MTLPLLVLGVLAVIAGGMLIGVPGTGHGFAQLFPGDPEASSLPIMLMSTAVALAGIALAYAAYAVKVVSPAAFKDAGALRLRALQERLVSERRVGMVCHAVVLAGSASPPGSTGTWWMGW